MAVFYRLVNGLREGQAKFANNNSKKEEPILLSGYTKNTSFQKLNTATNKSPWLSLLPVDGDAGAEISPPDSWSISGFDGDEPMDHASDDSPAHEDTDDEEMFQLDL